MGVSRHVYQNDAEDIKAHKWFRDIDFATLHLQQPPFEPEVRTADDTQYFDEEDPISDFSTSTYDQGCATSPPSEASIEAALDGFPRETVILAKGFVGRPYDSKRLKGINREIMDMTAMGDEQKEFLMSFVKAYGRRERKRPRDRILRDKAVGGEVLSLRKKVAFMGYSYRRIRVKHNDAAISSRRPGLGELAHESGWERPSRSIQ